MKPNYVEMASSERGNKLRQRLHEGRRLGLITSFNGEQLLTVLLDPANGSAEVWDTPVEEHRYHSLTSMIPQCHWFERTTWDMFGLEPEGHPRLKHNLLHEPYAPHLLPLRQHEMTAEPAAGHRDFKLLEVRGDGPYEVPVGPIHAGIIEPGHFRFSCLGEIILNLEIHLGYVHRGVEKRLTEVPWRKARFVCEAAASDMAAAYALAHAIAIESICDIDAPPRAQVLRTLALEIERVNMHIADLGGIAGDIGFLAIGSSMSRLRGSGLGMADLLTGSRFLRAFILPGGVSHDPSANLKAIADQARELRRKTASGLKYLMEDPVAMDRMHNVGRLAPHLASDFGIVGVAGRASNQRYDTRQHFRQGVFPEKVLPIAVQSNGDVQSRAQVRLDELRESLLCIEELASSIPAGPISVALPANLPPDRVGLGVVEAHRGELLHLLFTDATGKISRYAIKDPSVNNWTALAIAIRNNLLADFPLTNKSFALSYSGHDL